MKPVKFVISFLIGLGLLLIVLVWAIGAGDPNGPVAQAAIREMDLAAGGRAYEVNPDVGGNLWVSDLSAKEIWQVSWASGTYTAYHDLPAPADARRDAAGDVWWASYYGQGLGRLSVEGGTVTTWTIPGASYPSGVAFDDAGRVWVTISGGPRLYQFDPATTEVCTYTYEGGYSPYVVLEDGVLWLGDYTKSQLVRLDPGTNQFTRWQLHGAQPVGLAIDASGHLWWADDGLSALGHLDPASNVVTTYTLPFGATPQMIALDGQRVWYSEVLSGSFGLLDPAAAHGISTTLVPVPASVVPACTTLGAGVTSAASTSSGTIAWIQGTTSLAVDGGGWQVYDLSSGARPIGVALSNGAWIVDQGRDRLIWFRYQFHLPLMFRAYP
jgi:streptogramin lyase